VTVSDVKLFLNSHTTKLFAYIFLIADIIAGYSNAIFLEMPVSVAKLGKKRQLGYFS